jgi:hypothetical protein
MQASCRVFVPQSHSMQQHCVCKLQFVQCDYVSMCLLLLTCQYGMLTTPLDVLRPVRKVLQVWMLHIHHDGQAGQHLRSPWSREGN